jgi:hypothetical protein
MRSVVIAGIGLLLVALAAGCGGSRTAVRTVTVGRTTTPSAMGDQRLYGRIRSLVRMGDHFELRFVPALFLSGVTANVAQAEAQGTACEPSACPPVANDNYVVDEGHLALFYVVPAGVRGTVLTRTGSNGGPFPTTSITATQLVQLVAGRSSLKLFEPLASGVWILVHGDTVRAFAQQYRP